MQRFRCMRSVQKFANHFNHGRSISSRDIFKLNGTTVLAEWRSFGAG